MTLRSSSVNHGTSATPSVTVPSGIAANDIAIIKCGFGQQQNILAYLPSGFTVLSNPTGFGNWVGDGTYISCWLRASGSESGSFTFGATGAPGGTQWVVVCELYSGRDTGNPPVQSTFANDNVAGTSPDTITSNGVTAVTGDDLTWVAHMDWATGHENVTFTYPSGFTQSQTYSNNTDNNPAMGSGYKENVSSGATGTQAGSATWSFSATDKWGSELIRIPAGVTGGVGLRRSLLGCG